jgi:molybdopterin converting factor small subunit
MAVLRLTGLLAQEVGARRVEVDAPTVRDALLTLPGSLVLDEHGDLRPLVHVYVDGSREHDLGAPLEQGAEVILIAAIAGGVDGEDR